MVMDRVSVSLTVACIDKLSKIHIKWEKEFGMADQDLNFIVDRLAEKELKQKG